ncbi:MAG: hypothetical protein EBX46_06975 [Burkholderiaceae bacterium]|nr:hypothetical protein [Burkholderiaceae bacterium]
MMTLHEIHETNNRKTNEDRTQEPNVMATWANNAIQTAQNCYENTKYPGNKSGGHLIPFA